MDDGMIVGLSVAAYFVGYIVAATLLTLLIAGDGEVDARSVAGAVWWAAWWPIALPFVVPGLLVFWLARKIRG